MKNKPFLFILILTLSFQLSACNGTEFTIRNSTSTPTATLTTTPSQTPSQTPTPSPTFTATITLTPQTLGPVFPDGFHGQAVWSNGGGNPDRDYQDEQWFCPPDGSTINCVHHVIHFDVSLPYGFTASDLILSPVDGYVENIYSSGGKGKSIVIVPEPTFAGVPELLANRDRIDTLAKGIFTFDYAIKDVKYVSLHLAHVVSLVEIGQVISKGQQIAMVDFETMKIAYVIYIHLKDGNYYQFSPCDVPNEDEFCGKCTPGSPYPCP